MERSEFKIEICANSVRSCMAAQNGGADRVELCAGIPEGGTTPSCGMIRCARRSITIDLNVIIRPRGGDFLYSPAEISEMLEDIRVAKGEGADGLVFGALTPEGDVDMETMRILMDEAGDIPVTFHRAFDHARDPFRALESIKGLGCCRILTSGRAATASEGCLMLGKLVGLSSGFPIIMPGCGIDSSNIARIARMTGASEFHFSARENSDSAMLYRNPSASMGKKSDDYSVAVTSEKKVSEAIDCLIRC